MTTDDNKVSTLPAIQRDQVYLYSFDDDEGLMTNKYFRVIREPDAENCHNADEIVCADEMGVIRRFSTETWAAMNPQLV
jgi:hypothetical protein